MQSSYGGEQDPLLKLSLEEAEKIYHADKKGSEGYDLECDECRKVLQLAKSKRSKKVIVDSKTNHLVGVILN